ncbi:MAG: bifunctional riboflavin kinase/FMN adenylyltransferase [Bacteroidales bacterium]|nr:bifunctional riboflavin kinase/FMN adenylyltransferase [Bacteroidales bacterium]
MAVVATGFFDGVHLGHRRVIGELVRLARQKGGQAVAVTFSQHPRAVFQRDATSLRLLTSPPERRRRLEALGVDRVEELPFTPEFAAMTAADYVREVLVGRFGATDVVLGYDNRFGSDSLSTDELAGLLRDSGLGCVQVPPLEIGDETVSSTKIRSHLAAGRVDDAAAMLGYDYPLTGVVVPGKQLGRRLGFPTANLQLSDPRKQVPARGVYLTRSEVMGRSFFSMTNVGDIVETNIFDFDRDIYSLELTVSFLERVRDMRPFGSLGELSAQLAADAETCRRMALEF